MDHPGNHRRSCVWMLVLLCLVAAGVGAGVPPIASAEDDGTPVHHDIVSIAFQVPIYEYDTHTDIWVNPDSLLVGRVSDPPYYSGGWEGWGTITFKDSGLIIAGCSELSLYSYFDNLSSHWYGYANCRPSLTVGTHHLTAEYSGHTETYTNHTEIYRPSTSTVWDHVVSGGGNQTTTSIMSVSPNVSVVGQPVVVAYEVSYSASATPTGDVTVSGGVDDCIGPAPIGSCTVTLTSAGSQTLTASYAGDSNYSASSGTASHTVSRATTLATILSDDPDPSYPGQEVVVNYAITVDPPGDGSPPGDVEVSDGVVGCVATVDDGTCTLTPTTPGTRTLTLTYLGDVDFTGSAATTSHTVLVYPVPAITGISPTSIAAASPEFTLTITGTNFFSGSVVQWNGAARPKTYVSSTVLEATIPAADVANVGVAHITVVNPAPGGGTSNQRAFFTSALGTPISASSTVSGTNPSATTGGSQAVTANATGQGALTVALYGSNPVGTPSFGSSSAYIDVHLAPGHSFTALTIVDCHLNGGTLVEWWNGSTWSRVSNQSYDGATHCVTITVNGSTSPSLADLTGTPFGAGSGRLLLPLIVR